jgi:hypothetical protein
VEPVRVKVYGLVSMTRRGYLVQWALAVLFEAALLGLWLVRAPQVRAHLESGPPQPVARLLLAVLTYTPWVLGVFGVLLVLEAWVVLRCFARKKAGRAGEVPPPPADQ